MGRQKVFPQNIYIRIGRASATDELRVDLYKVLDRHSADPTGRGISHGTNYGCFFLKDGKGLDSDLSGMPVSELIERVIKAEATISQSS